MATICYRTSLGVTNLPDNHYKLFSRQEDIAYFLNRAKEKGVTFVTGRPMMGKTWLLREIGRQLVEREYIVGFVEAGGDPDDVFLRAIADAYERWLSDSSMREQAISMWKRRKGNLVTDVGRAVGAILKAAKDGPVGKLAYDV